MARQISMERALEHFERKCAELLRANVLLEAQNAELEDELVKARAEAAEATPEPAADKPAKKAPAA